MAGDSFIVKRLHNRGESVMVRFIMLGGFLGAGKTTAIARLARHYCENGLKIGIVTNDQAFDLVDTKSLRAQGFDVGEVPGACFCCKFNDLVDTAAALAKKFHPDVIICEPVGSCTDLVATVIEPLHSLHGDEYEIAPLVVLLKPEHGKKILGGESGSGFSPKAAYIFLKQIEEADVVAINKVDKLNDSQREQLSQRVADRFPEKTIVFTSGKTGEGFDEIIACLEAKRACRDRMMDVDYDVYAEGEAELGWLNCTAAVNARGDRFEMNSLVRQLVNAVATRLAARNAEVAHLKVLVENNDSSAIANLVATDVDVELSVASHASTFDATVVVNARVVCDPLDLEAVISDAFNAVGRHSNLDFKIGEVQRFRPGRPVPTHRVRS